MIEILRELITEIMDVAPEAITEETYLVRELGAESIDLLELSVAINHRFSIAVNDDDLYLRNFRLFLVEAERLKREPVAYLQERLPFLTVERIRDILSDLESGPALKVKDVLRYIAFRQKG